MAEDSISVSVGLKVKVQHPKNKYENTEFSRHYSRTLSVAPAPEDESKLDAYEGYLRELRRLVENDLRTAAEEQVQAEIDQFYADNGVGD